LKIEKLSETDKADATKQEKKRINIYRRETEKNLLLRLLL
jgi:hypothetical protein